MTVVTEPAMRSRILTATALAFGLALAGCESFDPLDKLQDLDIMATSKTPVKGERREVFPQGVPGVPQGVPPDMVKGYQPPPEAPPPVIEAKPKQPQKRAAAPKRVRPPEPVEEQVQQAPPARTTTTTQAAPGGAAAWPTMPGAQPTWPSQAQPAPQR